MIDLSSRAVLHLGSDRATALALGPRVFRTAARAIRFALEVAAPISLRGSSLTIGERHYTGMEMRLAYEDPQFPRIRVAAA